MIITQRHIKSRGHLRKGLALLALGSVSLLLCKLPLAPWLDTACAFGGGGLLLYGNGYMLYGLLTHADDRTYAEDIAAEMPPTQARPEDPQ